MVGLTDAKVEPALKFSDVLCLRRRKLRHSQVTYGVSLVILSIGMICFMAAAWAFSSVSPEPYMDEVFHVPQTQAYCSRNYGQWDPKITTPPGLYVFGLVYARFVGYFASVVRSSGPWFGGQECGAVVLRNVNWGLSVGTIGVMRAILARRMPAGKAMAHAVLLWMYPVSFFFSFLYYTDPGATFFVFLCYLLSTGPPRGGTWWRRSGSALAGTAAVLFRQTNAVWVAFTLAVCLLEDFAPLVRLDRPVGGADTSAEDAGTDCAMGTKSWRLIGGGNTSLGSDSGSRLLGGCDVGNSAASLTRKRKSSSSGDPSSLVPRGGGTEPGGYDSVIRGKRLRKGEGYEDRTSPENAPFPPLPNLLLRFIRAALDDAYRGAPLLRCRVPLGLPVVLFVIFVWGFNDGAVVLGDKENHSPGGPPHLAQVAYLSAVGASLWGLVGREAAVAAEARKGFVRWVVNRGLIGVAATVGAVAFALHRYTLAHPFLVSDNRHYSFYVWQRLLSSATARVALTPAYVFCAWLMLSRLLERKTSLWVLTYSAAVALVLVPSPLLEPRYLTIPVLFAHLESRERTWASLLAGVVGCAAVNAATIYTFLYRPFVWHDGSLARFMW